MFIGFCQYGLSRDPKAGWKSVEELEHRHLLTAISWELRIPAGAGDVAYRDQFYVGDIDGDVHPDLVRASTTGQISWLRSEGSPARFDAPRPVGQGSGSLKITDIDGDGKLDVTLVDQELGHIEWFRNLDGRGAFGPKKSILSARVGQTRFDAAFGDVDGDADGDWLVAWNDGSASIWRNDGRGNFVEYPWLHASSTVLRLPSLVDVDRDGRVDIVAVQGAVPIVWFEQLAADRSFGPAQVLLSHGSAPTEIHTADLNADHIVDLCLVRTDGMVAYDLPSLLTVNGERLTSNVPALSGAGSVQFHDFTGDGLVDIVASGPSGNLNLYHNNQVTRGYWTSMRQPTVTSAGAAITDLDADGDLDIVVGIFTPRESQRPSVVWLENVQRPGDLNDDGIIDGLDIDVLMWAIWQDPTNPRWDLNADGAVNLLDRQWLVEREQLFLVTGDSDSDADVDSADLLAFLAGWTGSLDPGAGQSSYRTDFDGDLDTDSSDLLILISAFTNSAW